VKNSVHSAEFPRILAKDAFTRNAVINKDSDSSKLCNNSVSPRATSVLEILVIFGYYSLITFLAIGL
jgi:hypothetical protein